MSKTLEEQVEEFASWIDSYRARVYSAQSRNEPGVDAAEVKFINWFEQALTQAEARGAERVIKEQRELPWFTDDVVWNAIMGTPSAGIISIHEFIERFERKYEVQAWRLIPHQQLKPLTT